MSQEPLRHLWIDAHEVWRHLLGLDSGDALFPTVVNELHDECITDTEENSPKELPVSPEAAVPLIGSPRLEQWELDSHGPNLPNGKLGPVRDDQPLGYLVAPKDLLVPTDDLLKEVEGAVILAREEHVL